MSTLCQLHYINSSSCQILALHLSRLPASGIALFFCANFWHYIFMSSHLHDGTICAQDLVPAISHSQLLTIDA
jgi:hypothetical protein